MSDEVDQSQERMDHEERIRRTYTKRTAMEALPTGVCLNCSEELYEIGQRWCDSECRDDWSTRQAK